MDELTELTNDIKPLLDVGHGMKLNLVIWFQPELALLNFLFMGNSNCQASTLLPKLYLQSLHIKVIIVFT